MDSGYNASTRERVLKLVKDTSRIHNQPCTVSDIHMILGGNIERGEIRFLLKDIADSNDDIKEVNGGYFYEGKVSITRFDY